MMIRTILLVVHIFLGATWVGGILFVGWGVFPATLHFSLENQRFFLTKLMKWTHYLFSLIGILVILTGVLLGTLFGPLDSLHAILNTRYGHIWLAAFIVGVITLFWGIFVGYREMMIVFSDDFLWHEAKQGNKQPLLIQFIRIALLESFEVVGFIVLIVLMVLF